MDYCDWYTKYITVYKRKLKPRTREGYEDLHRRYIAPMLGRIELGEITAEDVQQVINIAGDHGGRTAQAVYALIRAVLRRAVRSRLLHYNPVDAIDRPQHTPDIGAAMTEEDYLAALPVICDDLALALALLAGLRRGEIAGLQWGDIDLSGRMIWIHRTRLRSHGQLLTQSPKSTAGVRGVPISAQLLPILRRAYRLTPSAWVIRTAPEAIDRRWFRIQQRDLSLSRHYRLHDLRHTYVSRLLLAGAVPRVVQYVAGHADLSTTMRIYAHVSAADAKIELDRIASLTRQ